MSVTEPDQGLPDGAKVAVERSETDEAEPQQGTLMMLLRESAIVVVLALLLSLVV